MSIIDIKIFINGTTAIDGSSYDLFDVKTNKVLKDNTQHVLAYIEKLKIFIKGYESSTLDVLSQKEIPL